MKANVLLAGLHDVVIDDFFLHTEDAFFCVSTSMRPNDIRNHAQIFKPDVFVFSTGKDPILESEYICTAQQYLNKAEPLMVLITDKTELEDLNPIVKKYIDLILIRPLSIKVIQEQIESRLAEMRLQKEKEQEEEKQRLQEQQLLIKKEKKHVLVVDDDPVMLKTVKHYLEDSYIVATAPSGKFALKFLEQRHTDLVLLDYEMPELNGPEVFRRIRENEALNDTPVVFLTGITETKKIKEVLSMHPNGYLLKPVDYERLHQTLESLLED